MTTRPIVTTLLFVLAHASLALAQVQEPIPAFTVDVRGFYTGLGRDSRTATELQLTPEQLPARALGGVFGAHVYLWRKSRMTLGIGTEYLLARASRTPKPGEVTTPPKKTTPTTPDPIDLPVEPVLPALPRPAPVVHQRLASFSPQLSLNFGHREGWSYVTAGMGPVSLSTFTGMKAPIDPPQSKSTLNMGGGARWFATPHVAFMFDIRFYETRPSDTTPIYPGRDRKRLRVMSVGISVR